MVLVKVIDGRPQQLLEGGEGFAVYTNMVIAAKNILLNKTVANLKYVRISRTELDLLKLARFDKGGFL